MAFHLVHVQPPGDGRPAQLWVANTTQEEAMVAVRKQVPVGSEVKLAEGDVSSQVASDFVLAPGEVREFSDIKR